MSLTIEKNWSSGWQGSRPLSMLVTVLVMVKASVIEIVRLRIEAGVTFHYGLDGPQVCQ